MVAIIGGSFARFRPLVDLYREAGRRAGHAPETLKVGIHAMGFVGDTDRSAADAFFPGWAHMFTEIGRERGWSTATRAQFDAMCGPQGAFLIGNPQTVRDKIIAANDALGGILRLTFPNEFSYAGYRGHAALHRVARNRGCSSGESRAGPSASKWVI